MSIDFCQLHYYWEKVNTQINITHREKKNIKANKDEFGDYEMLSKVPKHLKINKLLNIFDCFLTLSSFHLYGCL